MRNRTNSRPVQVILFSLVTACLAAGEAAATNYTWTYNNLCLFPGCGWSGSGFWSPNGVPGTGDTATIAQSIRVVLTQHTGALDRMTLSNGARVHTRGFGLNVSSDGANTFLFGTGVESTGGNTQLVVDSGVYLGLDFLAFFFSMHQGAELRMNGGGALASFGINVSASSLISGHGRVILLDTGTRFDVAGHVRPSGGALRLWSLADGRLDLDGNVGGVEPGQIRVTSTGNLEIWGSLADPFSGSMEIGNSNDVEFDTAVGIDGQVSFTSGVDNHLIAPSIVFGAGTEVIVDGAVGYIDAPTDWPLDASIQLVAPTDELHLVGDSTFDSSTTWSGDGLLVNEWPGRMTLGEGSDVAVSLRNESDLVIDDSVGYVVVDDFDQPFGQISIDIEGTTPGVGHDQIHVMGDLNLGGDLELWVASNLPLVQGDSFEIISVEGASTGSFNGYGEGATVDTINGEELFITYNGGDGNDVVLYTLPEPGMAMGLGIGVMGLASARRRRDR